MFDAIFTNEATKVFQYIKDTLLKRYPSNKVTIDYFLLSVLENEDSTAYQILSKTTLISTLNAMREWFIQNLSRNGDVQISDHITYDILFDKCIETVKSQFSTNSVSSGHILLAILKLNEDIGSQFKQIGITYEQLITNLNVLIPPSETTVNGNPKNVIQMPQLPKGVVEELLTDMNKLAANGKIDEVIGNEEVYEGIFNALSKRDRNNVVLVGDPGVGKTATVAHIANLLVSGKVPEQFKNKKLMKMDFTSLVSGAAFRGNFEAKFNAIIEDATRKDGYIFFIDDLQSILSDKSKFAEMNTDKLLDTILMERNIKFICTMDKKSYSSCILSDNSLKRRFHKIVLTEKEDEEVIKILKLCKTKYEKYHNVTYTDAAIETCVSLSRRYAKGNSLPDYALDVMDETGAKKNNSAVEDERITNCKKRLKAVSDKINEINNSTEKRDYDEYDRLKIDEIAIKSELHIIEKDVLLNAKPLVITEDDIREVLSEKTNIPLTKLTENERDKLKNLNSVLKTSVIGQDDAIDEVCRAVKRQRVGMANNNRPAVLFFSGMSGTGKTYLAKELAKEVFGSEKSMIRLDMSEYSDKMSVSKLTGSAPGYIGYDKGGILTEAVKKNSHCVLLLDEMEKADEEVHNVFLQLFDEGRLTDNMGNIVDFSNVIAIMTSNVGAKEISSKGNGIGFIRNNDSDNREAIEKAMKRKFRPEFINRIDSIVYFNRLSEENIKAIIRLEIDKLGERLENIKYHLGESFKGQMLNDYIYNKVKDHSEYGARPVIHTIQREIEDKITDYIVDEQPNEGFVFETDILEMTA